jgi:hypothetical protein
VWENFISNSFGAVTYRLDISSADAMFAQQDVLINTATGLVQAVPSRLYSADVTVVAVDSTGDSARIANWSFTAHDADTVNRVHGPNGLDCVNGARVDSTRYDEIFSCNCSGTNFVGANCDEIVALVLNSPVAQTADSNFPEALNWSDRAIWALDRTYFFKPVAVSSVSFTTAVNVSLLRYFIVVSSTGPLSLMDPSTGFAQLTPRELSNTTASVKATLPGYPDVYIVDITFDVRLADIDNPAATGPEGAPCSNGGIKVDIDNGRSEFDLHYTCDCSETRFDGSNCDGTEVILVVDALVVQQEQPGVPNALAWDNRSMWAVGRSYFLKPVNIGNITFSASIRGPVNTTLLRYLIDPAPTGLLIDPATGFAQLTPRNISDISAKVYVTLSGYPPLNIGNITFDIRQADVDNPNATGPGGTPCLHGGEKTDVYDGRAEFNLNYSCNCSGTGFAGDNCDQADSIGASLSSSDNQVSILTYAIVGSLILLLLIALAVARIQVYRARNKPVDMTAMQDEIRGSLGMTTTMTVGPGELGLTMSFDRSFELSLRALNHTQAEALSRSISSALLARLRQQNGLPARLSEMLKHSGTTASVDPQSATALVVMKLPVNGALKAGSEERFAAVLQQRASSNAIVVNDEHVVVDVSIAVPRHVPRELDRHSILRLKELGEGFFGEVRVWGPLRSS